MYDISFKTAPSTITDFFIEAKAKHDHDTIFSSSGNYYINISRLNQSQGSFVTFAAKLWNSIHVKIRNLSKGSLNKYIENLLKEDDYVLETTILLQKISQTM